MYLFIYLTQSEGSLGGVVSDVQDCDMMTGFELQSRYYIHFRINNRGKGMKPHSSPPPPHYASNSTTTILLQEWLLH